MYTFNYSYKMFIRYTILLALNSIIEQICLKIYNTYWVNPNIYVKVRWYHVHCDYVLCLHNRSISYSVVT